MTTIDLTLTGWRGLAACRDLDPELFFPVGTTGPALEQTDRALAVCAACPVRASCAAWALEIGLPDGIAGGMTEDERRAVRRL